MLKVSDIDVQAGLILLQKAGRTRSFYLQFRHLQLSIQAQQGCWLQGKGEEVGQRVPVPVLAEDGQGNHGGAPEVPTVTAEPHSDIASTCKDRVLLSNIANCRLAVLFYGMDGTGGVPAHDA